MAKTVLSDVLKISKDVQDFETALSEICGGEIIRWAIINVTDKHYKISFSYKK